MIAILHLSRAYFFSILHLDFIFPFLLGLLFPFYFSFGFLLPYLHKERSDLGFLLSFFSSNYQIVYFQSRDLLLSIELEIYQIKMMSEKEKTNLGGESIIEHSFKTGKFFKSNTL